MNKVKFDKNLMQRKLKLIKQTIFIYFIGFLAILALLQIINEFKLKIDFGWQFNIFGSKFTFPSMTKDLFWSVIIAFILGICGTLFSLSYLKHQKNLKGDKSNFATKPLIFFILYGSIYEVVNLLLDEVVSSIANSLDSITPKNIYFWIAYCFTLLFLVIGYLFNIKKINSINDLNTKSSELNLDTFSKLKKFGIKAAILIGLSSIIMCSSLAINALPQSWETFAFTPKIFDQQIAILSNHNQMIIMLIVQTILFGLAFGLMEAIEEKNYKKYLKNLPKDVCMSLLTALIVTLSISAINNLKTLDPSTIAIFIPIIMLALTWSSYTFLLIKQFGKSNIENKHSNSLELDVNFSRNDLMHQI